MSEEVQCKVSPAASQGLLVKNQAANILHDAGHSSSLRSEGREAEAEAGRRLQMNDGFCYSGS